MSKVSSDERLQVIQTYPALASPASVGLFVEPNYGIDLAETGSNVLVWVLGLIIRVHSLDVLVPIEHSEQSACNAVSS